MFNGRTGAYSKHRPSYPAGIISVLVQEGVLGKNSGIADIGSGTGKLAQVFLENGHRVTCIEPNREMRSQARADLGSYPACTIMDGTAESTGLEGGSVDLVVAGQAFHWFNPQESVAEFRRILKPGGKVALVWNDRIQKEGSFNASYESICRKYSNGYHQSGSQSLDRKTIDDFFGGALREFKIENTQKLDLNGVIGRYLSASYALGTGDPRYPEAIREMESAFSQHSIEGYVEIHYETRVFLGEPVPGQ